MRRCSTRLNGRSFNSLLLKFHAQLVISDVFQCGSIITNCLRIISKCVLLTNGSYALLLAQLMPVALLFISLLFIKFLELFN